MKFGLIAYYLEKSTDIPQPNPRMDQPQFGFRKDGSGTENNNWGYLKTNPSRGISSKISFSGGFSFKKSSPHRKEHCSLVPISSTAKKGSCLTIRVVARNKVRHININQNRRTWLCLQSSKFMLLINYLKIYNNLILVYNKWY